MIEKGAMLNQKSAKLLNTEEKEEKIQRMVDLLEDNDDVQRVFSNSSVTN